MGRTHQPYTPKPPWARFLTPHHLPSRLFTGCIRVQCVQRPFQCCNLSFPVQEKRRRPPSPSPSPSLAHLFPRCLSVSVSPPLLFFFIRLWSLPQPPSSITLYISSHPIVDRVQSRRLNPLAGSGPVSLCRWAHFKGGCCRESNKPAPSPPRKKHQACHTLRPSSTSTLFLFASSPSPSPSPSSTSTSSLPSFDAFAYSLLLAVVKPNYHRRLPHWHFPRCAVTGGRRRQPHSHSTYRRQDTVVLRDIAKPVYRCPTAVN